MEEDYGYSVKGSEIGDMFFGKTGQVNFPANMQMPNLGITQAFIERTKISNRKILDLACGKKANLVYYLRDKRVEAEGIDPVLELHEDFLIKQAVTSIYPNQGSIPRQDEYYNYVFAHQAYPITIGLTSTREYARLGKEVIERLVRQSPIMLFEALRVLAKGGSFVCWPGLNRLEGLEQEIITKGYRISQQESGFLGRFREAFDILGTSTVPEAVKYRTVIKRL